MIRGPKTKVVKNARGRRVGIRLGTDASFVYVVDPFGFIHSKVVAAGKDLPRSAILVRRRDRWHVVSWMKHEVDDMSATVRVGVANARTRLGVDALPWTRVEVMVDAGEEADDYDGPDQIPGIVEEAEEALRALLRAGLDNP